jgi:hypothetical protein
MPNSANIRIIIFQISARKYPRHALNEKELIARHVWQADNMDVFVPYWMGRERYVERSFSRGFIFKEL